MTTCDRLWEVEAARDGRLPDREKSRAIEHQSTCEVCGAERASLEQLAEDLRASRPSADDLALRRVRNAVLARVSRPAAPRASRRWVGAATAAAIALGVGLAGWATVRDPGGVTASPSGVVIDAQEGGLASHIQSGSEDRVLLSEGRFAVDVGRRAPGRRLVFALPDGELEDRGTRFEVSVRGGQTIGVIVHEGAVVLRRTGHEEVHLGAGAAWSLPREIAPDRPRDPERLKGGGDQGPVSSSVPGEAPVAPPAACAVPRTPPPPAATPGGAGPMPAPLVSGGASPRAREGAVAEGAVAEAKAAEAKTLEEMAAKIRALEEKALEDEAYLRVVALLREGRDEEARLAARSYLRRFPEGLRRTEIAAIAR